MTTIPREHAPDAWIHGRPAHLYTTRCPGCGSQYRSVFAGREFTGEWIYVCDCADPDAATRDHYLNVSHATCNREGCYVAREDRPATDREQAVMGYYLDFEGEPFTDDDAYQEPTGF